MVAQGKTLLPTNEIESRLESSEFQIQHTKKVNTVIAQSTQAIYTNLHSASPKAVSTAAMQVLTALQDRPEDIQLAGAAVVFLALCRRFEIEPSTALNAVDNIIRDARRYDKGTFRGIEDYFDNEF